MKLRSTNLLRAVTFSSLAALTSLVACGDDEDRPGGTAGSAGTSSTAGKAGGSSGGSSAAGSNNGGTATAGQGGTNSAGTTTAGTGGASAGTGGSTAGTGGSTAGTGGSTAGTGGSTAGTGGSPVAGAGGEAGSGGDGGGGGGGGAGGEMAGAGGMGGAPDVPTPINLSIGKTATADSEENGNGVAKAIDDDITTRWCAANGDDGHWMNVDLGASHALTGAEIVWEKGTGTDQATATYKYKIEVSTDNATWTPAIDQTANVSAEHVQAHVFSANARYVRLTVLDIVDPGWLWACTLEVRVMGY